MNLRYKEEDNCVNMRKNGKRANRLSKLNEIPKQLKSNREMIKNVTHYCAEMLSRLLILQTKTFEGII